MRKTAHRHDFSHRLPTHVRGELRDDHFEGNAVQTGSACRVFIGIHARILQAVRPERLQYAPLLPCEPVMTAPVRLAKYLASSLPCSRREAELYIEGGWVSVAGQVVEAPQFMLSQQQVTLHPDARLTPVTPVTLLFNQPPGYPITDTGSLTNPAQICAATQSADDGSGIHLLKRHFLKLTPCMPLEHHASGMRILTQDWRVERKLQDDAQTMEQEYVAEVAGELSPSGLKLLNHGLKFNGKPLPPCKVSWQNETRLRFALKGVVPGSIAHQCQSVGLELLSLKRIRIGRVSMGRLQPGQWRYLVSHERF